jgi:hypothetical protein
LARRGAAVRANLLASSETIYAAFRYPGVVEHVGALNTRDGSETRLADIKGAKLYKVASFAYDPASGTAFFTNDNTAYRDLMSVDVRTGEQRLLLQDEPPGQLTRAGMRRMRFDDDRTPDCEGRRCVATRD